MNATLSIESAAGRVVQETRDLLNDAEEHGFRRSDITLLVGVLAFDELASNAFCAFSFTDPSPDPAFWVEAVPQWLGVKGVLVDVGRPWVIAALPLPADAWLRLRPARAMAKAADAPPSSDAADRAASRVARLVARYPVCTVGDVAEAIREEYDHE